MNPMPDFNPRPDGPAEELIAVVFQGRVADADPQLARLALANKLRRTAPAPQLRPGLRFALQLALGICALLVFGGWASSITIKPWDDAQQITLALPADWTPSSYPQLVGRLCSESESLASHGGHSLIVDYRHADSGYYLELGILGVDYQTANDWSRELLRGMPELSREGYSITQPLVPYAISVGDMLAYSIAGNSTAVQSNVVAAWQQRSNGARSADNAEITPQGVKSRNERVYLIARDKDYALRSTMVQ